MGIKPDRDANLTPPTSTSSDRYGDMNAGLEADGAKAGEVLKDINAKAGSANAGATELAADLTAAEKRITSLENLPLLLHWDGTGTRPQLKPGWGLLNTTTGVVEKG